MTPTEIMDACRHLDVQPVYLNPGEGPPLTVCRECAAAAIAAAVTAERAEVVVMLDAAAERANQRASRQGVGPEASYHAGCVDALESAATLVESRGTR